MKAILIKGGLSLLGVVQSIFLFNLLFTLPPEWFSNTNLGAGFFVINAILLFIKTAAWGVGTTFYLSDTEHNPSERNFKEYLEVIFVGWRDLFLFKVDFIVFIIFSIYALAYFRSDFISYVWYYLGFNTILIVFTFSMLIFFNYLYKFSNWTRQLVLDLWPTTEEWNKIATESKSLAAEIRDWFVSIPLPTKLYVVGWVIFFFAVIVQTRTYMSWDNSLLDSILMVFFSLMPPVIFASMTVEGTNDKAAAIAITLLNLWILVSVPGMILGWLIIGYYISAPNFPRSNAMKQLFKK